MIYWNGAYRKHRPEDVAIDDANCVDGLPQVLLLEPGTGEWLEIPVGEDAFHREELMQEPDAAVAYSFYRRWLDSGETAPAYEECIGYKTPLYLGGVDDLENLQRSTLDVYWTVSAQLLSRIRGLPIGTRIADISIAEGS
jgi:hypothetical protein